MLDGFVALESLWTIAIAIFFGLIIAEYAGAAARRLLHTLFANSANQSTGFDYIVSSVFALLGLLIAFTFGMALDRYEMRRDLVVQEANAIGTAHIRTAFANEPDQTDLRSQLESYAANRLAYGNAKFEGKAELALKSAGLRTGLAMAGVGATKNVASATLGPSLIASINDVIDIGSEREAANLARVPQSVLLMLLGYSMIAAFVLGYAQASAGGIQRLACRMLFILLTLALVTILDLDRPASGAIKVSQQPMIDLIAGFQS